MIFRPLLVVIFYFFTGVVLAQQIRVIGKQAKEDTAHEYFLELLSLSLTASTPQYPAKDIDVIDMKRTTQGRTLNLLAQGFVDVFWSGTDYAREEQFIPVKIPLFQGLLGYRVAIIHQDNLTLFNELVKQPQKLKALTACQAEHWPDSDILENNGFKVARIVRYDSMIKMLAHKRCDYFPRAIFEGYSELNVIREKYPELIMFDQLILHYPFAIYFFVNKNNPELANQLTYGLNQLILDGRFKEMIKNHPLSAHLYPLDKWQNRQFLHLVNPDFPTLPENIKQQLWIQLYR